MFEGDDEIVWMNHKQRLIKYLTDIDVQLKKLESFLQFLKQ